MSADFNPRSSCEERHDTQDLMDKCLAISIHAPHARSDVLELHIDKPREISIHAPHARSDLREEAELYAKSTISIHAPHARSDRTAGNKIGNERPISIHAPHARSDWRMYNMLLKHKLFQSTLLMRGATMTRPAFCWNPSLFQSTLLMRGATQYLRQHGR